MTTTASPTHTETATRAATTDPPPAAAPAPDHLTVSTLVAAGRRLEYRWISQSRPGTPPLVLLHEGLGDAALWGDFPRRLAERTITWARRVGDVLTKKPDRRSTEESARVVHAVRMARRVVRDRGAVLKLFDELAPRYLGRRGGYTRIVKLGQRPGDAAPMSLLELMPDETPVAKPAPGPGGMPPGRSQGQARMTLPAATAPDAEGRTPARGTQL